MVARTTDAWMLAVICGLLGLQQEEAIRRRLPSEVNETDNVDDSRVGVIQVVAETRAVQYCESEDVDHRVGGKELFDQEI